MGESNLEQGAQEPTMQLLGRIIDAAPFQFPKGACVTAAMTLASVLRAHGVESKVVPVAVTVANGYPREDPRCRAVGEKLGANPAHVVLFVLGHIVDLVLGENYTSTEHGIQPPRLIFGRVPENWVAGGVPHTNFFNWGFVLYQADPMNTCWYEGKIPAHEIANIENLSQLWLNALWGTR